MTVKFSSFIHPALFKHSVARDRYCAPLVSYACRILASSAGVLHPHSTIKAHRTILLSSALRWTDTRQELGILRKHVQDG